MTEDRKRAPTIVDVAEKAGVAIGTVSRFLNGEPVRAANRDQIERAIADLGYQRNAAAVAMKTDETRVVGFMAPNLSEFHAALLDRLSRKMRLSGRAVLSFCHDLHPATMREGLEFFARHRVDALVIDGEEVVKADVLAAMDRGLEIVLYDNDLPGVAADRVFVDNRAVSARMVGHLIDLGHRRIAVVHGAQRDLTGRERLQGWRDAHLAAGLEPDPGLCLDGDWTENGGAEAMAALLALPEPPSAVFSCNYNMTLGVLAQIHQAGMEIPRDISLASFDDVPALRLHRPGITTVAQPIDRIADAIHDLVLARLENPGRPGKREVRIDCEILLRGSVRRPLQKGPPDGPG